MKKIKVILCILQIAICIYIFNFSLMNYEFYTQHYKEFLYGHIFAVTIILFTCFCITSLLFYFIDKDLKKSIKQSLYLSGISAFIVIIYIIIDIDYDLLG